MNPSHERPFGCALLVVLSKPPLTITKTQTQKLQDRKARVKTSVKLVNHAHFMPTRYNLEFEELKDILTNERIMAKMLNTTSIHEVRGFVRNVNGFSSINSNRDAIDGSLPSFAFELSDSNFSKFALVANFSKA